MIWMAHRVIAIANFVYCYVIVEYDINNLIYPLQEFTQLLYDRMECGVQ